MDEDKPRMRTFDEIFTSLNNEIGDIKANKFPNLDMLAEALRENEKIPEEVRFFLADNVKYIRKPKGRPADTLSSNPQKFVLDWYHINLVRELEDKGLSREKAIDEVAEERSLGKHKLKKLAKKYLPRRRKRKQTIG